LRADSEALRADGTRTWSGVQTKVWLVEKDQMKESLIGLGLCCAIVFAILAVRTFSAKVLFSTVSPNQQYRVEITQSRQFPFNERAVLLKAYRNGNAIVYHKLLYTGDLLDNDFRDLYSNPRFRSESIYELGSVTNDGSNGRTGDLTILMRQPRTLVTS
jgi:hypothetical protein